MYPSRNGLFPLTCFSLTNSIIAYTLLYAFCHLYWMGWVHASTLCLHSIPLYEPGRNLFHESPTRGYLGCFHLCYHIIYNEITACMKFFKVEVQSKLHLYFDRYCQSALYGDLANLHFHQQCVRASSHTFPDPGSHYTFKGLLL